MVTEVLEGREGVVHCSPCPLISTNYYVTIIVALVVNLPSSLTHTLLHISLTALDQLIKTLLALTINYHLNIVPPLLLHN